jgi:hypothetical protein
MKKHHFVLILLLAIIAAVFLNEGRKLKSRESSVRDELNLLRDAARKSPGTAVSLFTARISRPPAIDPETFSTELANMLRSGSSEDARRNLEDFLTENQARLEVTSSSKLKDICSRLKKNFPLDGKDSETAHAVWLAMVGLVAKSDPAWAFAEIDAASTSAKTPIESTLATFKNWRLRDGETMSPAYADALQKWLDAAQAAGRMDDNSPLVAELRSDIAAAQGNQAAAIKQISQLPFLGQRQAAIDHVKGLQTPEARRQAMEELSTALNTQNFPHVVRELAGQQGFDAAREILNTTSLTPEKHDLAAASIAAADIGPETPAKAKWLLESLRSDDKRAILEFANQWTHADYQGAAKWLSSLPTGKQRDTAVFGFATVATKIDGATAVDWALTITDPNVRRSCLEDVVRMWRKSDAEATNAYLREKGIEAR